MSDRLVDEVNENTMDGDTRQEKWLNAYLTSQYVITKAIPADECLGEARMIIKTLALMDTIDALNKQRGSERMTTDTAKQLLEMSEPVAVAFYQPVMMDGKPLNMVTSLTPLPTADLQAMAKLWQLKRECQYAVQMWRQSHADNVNTIGYREADALLAKLAALEEK